MMYLSIHRAFKTKGVKNAHKFLKNLGFHPAKATELTKGVPRLIRVDELEKICYALWCSPNDLFDWDPDAKFPVIEGHPINAIKRRNEELDIANIGRQLTVEQLRELSAHARKMMEQNREELK
jgi:DNA-binding Xre family transcriptional regulator